MDVSPFAFSVPTQVRFGAGVSADLPAALPSGARHIAVLRGASGIAAEPLVRLLEAQGVTLSQIACAGEPSTLSVNEALGQSRGQQFDAVVAIGGGAVMDSAKAVAFCHAHGLMLTDDLSAIPDSLLAAPCPLPCIAVPTTAGTGAEVTANAVLDIPSQRAKVSLRGRALFPGVALVDPALLATAPDQTLLCSGLDAVVQTIEAYTSCKATPFTDALTRPNIEPGFQALQGMLAARTPEAARALSWVSLTSGIALANGGLGAAHGIASVLGGRYGAQHGALCGRLIVPVLRRNRERAGTSSEAEARLAVVFRAVADCFAPLHGQDALSGLEAWQAEQALPRLAQFGLQEADIDTLSGACASASSSQKNAVPLAPSDYADILRAAL